MVGRGDDVRPGGADATALDALERDRVPVDAEPGERAADLVGVGAGVDQGGQRHVAGHAGLAVEPGDASPAVELAGLSHPASPDDAGDGAGGAEPVVDADDRHPAGTRRVHGEERGHPFEGRAVSDARGHGDDRRAGEPTDHAGEGALHPGDDDDRVRGDDVVEAGEQPVQAGDADVGDELRRRCRRRAA